MTKKQARSHSADRPRRWGQAGQTVPVSRSYGRLLCGASLAAMALIGLPSTVHAQEDRYWDPNGTATGSGGTGTWNTSSPSWSPSSDGVSGPYTVWNNVGIDNAIFGGPNGTVATVTLGTPITVHNVTFNATTTYTLTGSTLTLAGTTPTITTNGNATINSILAGNAGLTKAGAGALTLTGANTFSGGVNITAGTLSINGDSALGHASNGLAVSAGATLVSTSALAAGRVVTLLSGSSGIGGGVGSAHITGAGGFSLVAQTALSDDTNDFTGGVATNGFHLFFTSIGNLGEASALGAATTAVNGAVYVRNASAIYVGSGNTSNRGWSMAPFTGSSALRNQGTGTLTVTGDITASGGYSASVILDAQTADLALLGLISSNLATRPFVFMGGGTSRSITLGDANTFGGPATIQTVTVKAGSLANQGVASSLGTGGSILLNTGVLSYTGSGGGTDRALSINGSSSVLNDGTGALALSGAVAFNAAAPADNFTLGGSFVGNNTVSGVISGNGNLVMNGIAGSAWLLSGANTYVGTTTVTSGTLRAGSSQAFGALNAVTVNGGTLDLDGNDVMIASLAGSGGSVALNGGADLTINGATATSYGGSITGNGGLLKRGTGTLTLSGASTYSGATAIQGGGLALNFSSAGGPTSNIVSAFSALNLSGGTLDAIGAAGEANSQAFNGTNITAGNNTIRAQSGAGGSFTLNLGAINRTGGLVNFVLPTSGNITTISPDGALGGWATINGSDYAKVLAGGIVAFDASDYTDQDNAGLWAAGQIISDAGGAANSGYFGTVGSSVQIGGLRYTAAANSTVTIGAGQAVGIDGTIIVAPSVGTFNDTITGGSITGAAGGGTLGVQQNGGGTFTVASTIVDNGGTINFAKAGTGLVSLTGGNTYTGATTVSGGTLAVNTIANGNAVSAMGASGNASSNLVIEGATLQYTGATTISDRGFTLLTSGVVTGGTINVSQSIANLTFTGLVTSPDGAGLTKAGPGTLTLSNAGNDYTGVTTVNGGTLSVGTLANGGSVSGIGAASSASSNVVLQSGGELEYSGGTVGTDRGFTLGTGGAAVDVFQGATTLTVSGTALGTGGLTKNGAGTLVLSGTNTYSGGTTINAGTLRAAAASAFGAGSMTVNAGGTLDVNNQNLSIGALSGNGTVTNLGTSALTLSGGTGAFNGAIGGSGALTRAGGGSQTFSGCNNTYTGVTSINGSTIVADCLANGGLASGIGASTSPASNLLFNNGFLTYTGGSVSIDRGFTLQSGYGVLRVDNAATTLGISGPITGGGQLYKRGPGTLVLSGNNTYTASTIVDEAGILRAGSTTAFGTSGVTMGNIAGAILDLNGFNNTIAALNGGGAAGGDITLGGATLTISNGGAFNYAGSISGSGNVVKSGGGAQGLLGCRSTYTGTTTVISSTLSVDCLVDGGVNSGIGTSSAAAGNLTLNNGTLFYTGAATSSDRLFTLGTGGGAISSSGTGALNLTNTGAIALSGTNTARTLTLAGTNTGDNVFSAQLDNNGTGATSLTKIGTGTWRLANANSTYTGITTISGGVLSVDKLGNGGIASSIGASAAAAANLVIGNGSTLRYTGAGDTTNRLFTLSPGVTFIESSGTGAIVFTDTGPVTLQTANVARTIALGGTNSGNNTLAGSIGNAGTGVTTLAKNDSGTWVLTGTNNYTGLTNINAGTLILGNGGTTGAIASATINNLGILGFNRSNTLTYGGVITQTGSVRQFGTGTTILTGANSYTGGTTISTGTLQLGNGGTTGSIVGNVLDIGVLAFNRSDTITFNGVISGSGSVRQSGAGTTILAGINSYAGGTAIDAGTLQVSSDANLGAAAGALSFNSGILRTTADITSARAATLTGAGTMLTDTGTSFTLSGVVSGAGGLTKAGTGTLILTGADNYAGGTTIAGGTLSLGNGGTTGSILGDVANNGALVFDRSDNIGFGGLVSGTGSVTQKGAGVVTLTANNNYTGVTNVNAGRLLINGNQSAATGLTSVASGAALGGSGIIGGNVNVANGGILAPGNSPGTMTINGNLSLASGSILDFEFGQADVVGGPLNDLVNVGGDLVLDGTLNVGVSAGGAFGGGIYRVFNYGGTLTDNGLALGLLPVGSSVTVQTSVAGQVNLINSVGLSLSFWDGNAGPKFNNVIDGGNGNWHLGGADNNWANGDGSVNASYADNTLAIFAGTGGTVTVDNTGGAVTASGLQFASNNYLINGSALTLTGPESMVRVGDGTAVGAGYTATIAAALAGTTRLVKTDLGSLVLSGANSYTGGTTINGGTLRIANDANLGAAGSGLDFNGGTLNNTATMTTGRAVTLTGAGTILTDPVTILRLDGDITGGGRLIKSGAGSLQLAGSATHSGGTTIAAGNLHIGNNGTTGSIAGDIVNDGVLTFRRSDGYTYGGSISGTGHLVQVGDGTLTLTGNSSYGGATTIGAGELRIAGGNTVTSGDEAFVIGGVLSVDGGSVFSTMGLLAESQAGVGATVNVQNGGILRTTAYNLDLRNSGGGGGLASLNISGAGSLADLAAGLLVGESFVDDIASATLSSGGALRTAGVSQIGSPAGNTIAPLVMITGAGSNWTSTSSLRMTNGAFSLLNGGAASFTTATIGSISAGPASVLVSGMDSSFTTTGNLTVGSNFGTGVVTLADGGLLNVGGSLVLANDVGATGVLNIGGGAAAGTLNSASVSLGSTTSQVNFNHNDPAYSFTALVSGIGNVSHAAGVTILTADNAYTGQTHINGGTIIVNGNQSAATGATNVNLGGTLGGMGVIGGTVLASGHLTPGDPGAAPGTLTINDNLVLFSSANLDYSFGQANVVGGAYNDLIEVGGVLLLDGTLNVAVTPGGSFDPGVYRVINYAGALTDNGLSVDPAYFVQTSVANQVNLVNTTGLTMRFWDGVAGGKNDGAITGGNGLWQASGGNDNWTEFDGSANAPFTDEAFAVFSGLGGTVTVDATLGAVTASGMQFASDGYILTGEGIALVAPESIIRVGDGTANGTGYTATIASNLTGVGDFVKSDLGTLVLTRASGFAGDVYVRDGELRLADGGVLTSANGLVGLDAGNDGVVTVTGSDGSGNASTWMIGTDLTVGHGGTGTLNIADGGKVLSGGGTIGLDSGGIGEILVTGTGSSWENSGRINVGLFGTGSLRIGNGATVTSDDGVVGGAGQGDVVVSGTGSSWINDAQLNIGSFGAGTMRIEDGASVTSNQGYIGANAAGSVTVTGAGSNWLVTDFNMTVGNVGAGVLTIEDGGRVRAESGFALGVAGGSSGIVTLLGTPGRRGTLETSRIRGGSGTANFTMDGGILRATRDEDEFFVGFAARDIALGANGGIIDTDGHDIGIAPAFVGTGGLTKDGAGTLTLTGTSSYAGATLVNAGTLFISGDQSAATGLTTVFSGATLGGNGIIGGDVDILDGATLAPGESVGTLMVGGNLSLASGSILAYEFGQAGVAGGALNDLVDVGGDLVLDGRIDVSTSAGGTFGPGIYRLFNYGGALTDGGLELGTIPGGTADILVQTSIAGQVNLVSSAGLTLSFWDGAIGPKNNSAVNGGDGVWRVAGGSNNWTDANGAVNADYAQDSLAIFSAAPGTVTIDNSVGNVLASGMQFASDGYVLTGDALTLTGAATIQVGDSSAAGAGYTATIAAELTGAAGLVKTDAGTLVLTAANSYTGGTTIDGGTLQIGNGGATGSITGDIANNAALVVDRSGAITLDGTISGTGSLTKAGSSVLTLTGTNSHSGGTLLDSGTLQVSSDANLGAVAGTLSLQGGTLQATASFTSARDILLGSPDSNSIDTQGFDVTLGGTIGDGPDNSTGNFVNKLGTGTLTLTGANTYSNRTVIVDGRLALAGAGTIGRGNLVVNTGTVFDISQTDVGARVIQLNAGPAGTIALGSRVLTLGFGNSSTSWSGAIVDGGIAGGTGGSVVIFAPAGEVRFNEANSYTGGTRVSNGRFLLAGNGALWSGGAVAVSAGATFDISGLAGAGTIIGDLSGTGAVALGGKTLTFGTANDTSLSGTIAGNGGALVKAGAGIFTLTGASSYTGGTMISAGTLQLGDGGTSGSIAGDVTNEGTLVFNRSDAVTFGGTISGSGAVDQFGSGTTILTGANSYTGTTSVSGGTLLVNGDQSLATGGTSVVAGTLGGTGTIGGDVFVGGGAVLAPGSGGVGALTINGDLGFSPNALLAFEFGQANVPGGALNDLVDVGGDLTLDGTLNVTQSAGGSFGPGVYRVINYAGTLTDNGLTVGSLPGGTAFVQTAIANQINLVNTAGLTLNFWDGPAGPRNDGTIQGGTGAWTLGGGQNDWTEVNGAVNADYAQDSFAIFQGTGGTVTVDNGGGDVRAAGMQFTVDGYTVAGGPLTLTGAQAFVRVGDGGAGDAAITTTISAALAGSAQMVKDMAGTLVLTGANSYTGGTVINGGTIRIASDANLGAAAGGLSFNGGMLHTTASFASGRAIDLVGTGTLLTDAGTTLTLDGMVTGAGALAKTGAGSLVLTADSNYAGGTTIGVGVLQIGNGGTTGSIAGNIANNGALVFDRSNELTISGPISGSGSVEQAGSGITTLIGTNSYAGATNVLAGTLLVNGDQSAASGLSSVASGATLGGIGTIGGDVVVADGATLAPGADGAGALTINGSLVLGSGSSLAYEFGRANAPGDPLNDVVNVGGDLTLDGTLDVAVTPGGAFDIGLYRVANYGGTLTDNGLALGTLPTGADVFVQTAVANQVNLVNVGGATLNFWDGAVGPKFNGSVNGGSGVWQAGGGNDNWADATGAVNAGYDDGAFAIFTGAAGTVTIDNGLGAVTASGLQFAVGGYSLAGGALTLTGPQSVIRVGDGTAAGAGHTATIGSTITGNTQLVKTDAGTLNLIGTNSYTGGTAINGGTVRIASDANLGAAAGGLSLNGGTLGTSADLSSARAVELAGAGTFLTDAGTTLTLAGAVSGAGSLTKSGTGSLALSGIGTYAGATDVGAGTLLVNGNYSAAAGATSVASGASLGGTGTIGGDVTLASGATLTPGAGGAGTLTINGDLSLASGTQLAYEFGQVNTAGGALNDLVNVGGDLTLDGTINVTVPTGGAFDVGVYRVFNYDGTLTNNGLTLGALPVGGDVAVQTAIAGQVNLVNSAGLMLSFWDGAAGPKNNGVINGGSGTWQNSTGNDNWTKATRAVNAAYSDGAFAVFGGTGGAVTVDNSLGAVTASGMQFAANGYTITGNAVALAGPQSTIRVGDGSAAGAGFTATINAALSGDTQLVKTDAGTLVLGGTNGYTGGTAINGGTVQISADANLGAASGDVTLDGGSLATSANLTSARDIVIAGAGTISTESGTTFTFNGLLSGTGALTNRGAGTLLLTGDNSGFAGGTRVEGTLVVNGSLCGDVNVAAGGRLGGTGTVCTTVNAGTVAPGNSIGTLTVAGTYTGNGGTLEIEAQLGGDASPSDLLVVTNGTAGSTNVTVINTGGLGAQTVEGIKIVDVTGGASNGAFALNGDYEFEGQQAVIAGAYGYRLYQGGVATPTDGDWYLRSALLDAPNQPQAPLYQPGVPLYESYAATLQTLNRLGTLQERVGNRQWSGFTQGGVGMWGRMEGTRHRPEAAFSTSGSDLEVNDWSLQAGLDKALLDTSAGTLIAGINGRYGKADAQVRSRFGSGEIGTKGYGVGATLTWYDSAGFYADAQAQVSWYRSDLDSTLLGELVDDSHGSGEAFSLELGKRAPLGGGLSVTPQIQMTYSNVRFDAFIDSNSAAVSSDRADSLKSRWGISLDHQRTWDGASGTRQSHLYGIVNLSYEWLDGAVADVSGTPIARRDDRLWSEIGVGGSYSWNGGRFTIFSEVSANTAINNFGDSNSLKGNAGFRMRF